MKWDLYAAEFAGLSEKEEEIIQKKLVLLAFSLKHKVHKNSGKKLLS